MNEQEMAASLRRKNEVDAMLDDAWRCIEELHLQPMEQSYLLSKLLGRAHAGCTSEQLPAFRMISSLVEERECRHRMARRSAH